MDPHSQSTSVVSFISVFWNMSLLSTLCDVCDVTKQYWLQLDSSGTVWTHYGDVCPTPVLAKNIPKIKKINNIK